MRPVPHIAIIVPDGAYLASVGIYCDLLGSMNAYARERFGDGMDDYEPLAAVQLRTLGVGSLSVALASGAAWRADGKLEDHVYDLVVIAAHLPDKQGRMPGARDLGEWLCRQRVGNALIAASGASIQALGEAGLLADRTVAVSRDGRQALRTYWPGARIMDQASVFEDRGVFTAAGLIDDFALALRLAGCVGTSSFAAWLHARMSGGQTARSEGSDMNPDWDHVTARAKNHIQENIRKPVRIGALADLLGVSTRTLARRFNAEEGLTPLEYLQKHRIRTAQRLLQKTDLSFEQIALMVGYANAGFCARLFRSNTGMTPRQWRHHARRHETGRIP